MFTVESQVKPVDCRELPKLFPAYVAEKQRAGRSDRTVQGIEMALAHFGKWLATVAAGFDYAITPERMAGFAEWLENDHRKANGEPYSPNSRSSFLKRSRAVLKWAYDTERCDRDISDWVPQVPQTARAMRPIDVDGIVRMLYACQVGHRAKYLRNMVVISLLCGTGARRSEVAEIRIENIQFLADDYGSIYLEITKGNVPRTVFIGPGTTKFLQPFLATLPHSTGKLFSVKSSMLWKIVDKAAARAGIDKVGPHDLRKFFALHWMAKWGKRDGMAKLALQAQLGHSGQDITEQHYLFLRDEHVRERYVSPMEMILEKLDPDVLERGIDAAPKPSVADLDTRTMRDELAAMRIELDTRLARLDAALEE